jgi:predicted ATPase
MFCPKCGHEKPQGARSCDFCDQDLNTPSDSTITDVVRSSGFVGRQRELGELTSALGDAISGHDRQVLLGGDPGISKTCIVQEFAAIADARSADVFWGHCYGGEGAPPYWPWLQILRSCVAESDAERFEAAMGSDAEAIGEIVPELRSKFPNLGVPPTFDPGSARFRLFDSITTYLKNASNDRTIVLMLEDLHWADASSLALLEHIVGDMAESNLLIVGTYRDNEVSLDHPLSRTLRNVVRHDGFQRPVIFSGIFGFAQRAQVFTKCSETNIYDCPGF